MSKTVTLRYLAVAALLLSATAACANPLGGQVVGGNATIEGQGTPGVVIDQSSQSAIINWQSFNIGSGETTRFNQPDASSVILNRVTGDRNPSSIFGTLTANGRVFLVNPDGFLFGPGSVINTGGFLATTHDIANQDFLAGRYIFGIPGSPSASIVNEGEITVSDTGIAALVAPGVRNDGIITARLGKIGLASAKGFTLDLYGDNLINFSLTDPIAAQVMDVKTGKPLTSLVENRGKLSADGGVVAMTATTARALVDSVVNNSGVIEANSVSVHSGKIVLGAATAKTKLAGSPTQKVVVKGTLNSSGKGKGQTGGKVLITGEEITVAGATIDASGNAGGGKVLIGGDTGGGTPSDAAAANPIAGLEVTTIPTATTVTIDGGTSIDVSAIADGNGGKAIVWADGSTIFNGTIAARGGSTSGNGGFVETSGREQLKFTGRADTSTANGLTGTLLLDPKNVTIGTSGIWNVTVQALQAALANNNVVVNTSAAGTDAGNITVAESVTWANGNSLTLSADHDITVIAGITISNTGAGNLVLRADSGSTGNGTVNLSAGAIDYSGSTGTISVLYNPTSYASETDYSPFVTVNGAVSSQLTDYMLVNNITDFQNIRDNLGGNYALGRDIDATATVAWNSGAGFETLGNTTTPTQYFFSIFDGWGHTIDGLYINRPGSIAAPFGGLFGGRTIRNVNFTNENITGGAAAGLVLDNRGNVYNVTVNGSITGGVGADGLTGGLAAFSFGNISRSSSSGSVTYLGSGPSYVGGLVGFNIGCCPTGIITQSFSTSTVSGGNATMVGGLVGTNGGTVGQSYALGSVIGGASSNIGGLIGWNGNGTVSEVYSAGHVGTGLSSGGLMAIATGSISNAYWDTQTSGQGTSAAGTGQTTAELKAVIPAGFNVAVWGLSNTVNTGYPYLLWQTGSAPAVPQVLNGPATLYYVATPIVSIYGTPVPLLTGTVTGFVNGDTLATATSGIPTFTTAATSASGIGQYAIDGSGLTLVGNYVIVQDPGNATALTIDPAQLAITAKDQSKVVGTTFTFGGTEFTTAGLVNGDSISSVSLASLGAPAFATVTGSPYPIQPFNAIGAGLGNYAIHYLPGLMTVTPMPPVVDGTLPLSNPFFAQLGLWNAIGQKGSFANAITSKFILENVSRPAIEQALQTALSPFVEQLPVDLRGSFNSDLKKALESLLGKNEKVNLSNGGLSILSIIIGDVVSNYIDIATTEITNRNGFVVGGASRYAMQVASNAVINYLSAFAADPAIVETGYAGVYAAVGIGVTQATVTNLVNLGLTLVNQ